jgi:hypothetical protein
MTLSFSTVMNDDVLKDVGFSLNDFVVLAS